MDWRALQSARAHHAAAAALNTVQFAFDSAEVAQTNETDLDLVGPGEYNDTLADRRADAVRDALIERGVPADRLTTAGYGESSPIDLVPGLSEVNRRVEVVPSLDLP
jgi:outer membrane protein OmpA-like peptidoglycan-associated protein